MNSKRCCAGLKFSWFPMVALFFGIVLALAGCGGGGGGDSSGGGGDTGTVGSSYVEGVAAAGAPIVGTINIRGADGTLSLSAIEADGAFRVNVDALTAPFTIWVEGSANGKEVTLYATIADPGRVNVTPVTHAIMALALGEDPEAYFSGDATAAPPSDDAIAQAKSAILSILDGVFGTVGLTDGFDLINGEFTADGTGFDAILDAIDMTVADGGLSIVDRISQTILAEGPLDGALTQEVDDATLAELVGDSVTLLGKIRAVFETIAAAYAANPTPALEDLTTTVRPLMADDFLDSGSGPDEELAEWVDPDGDMGPRGTFTVESIAIHRQMITRTAGSYSIPEQGDHQAGVWVVARLDFNGQVHQMLTGFVTNDGENWLWFGDRCPFYDSGSVDAYAARNAYASGGVDYDSGLDFWINDEGNLAYTNFGITYLVIANAALPEILLSDGTTTINGLLMARTSDIITEFDIIRPSTITDYGQNKYMESHGLDIDAITDNEFRFTGVNTAGEPVLVWIKLLQSKPIPTSEIEANPGQYFATLTSIAGNGISTDFSADDFNIASGSVALGWQLPVNDALDLALDGVSLGWSGSNGDGDFDIDREALDQDQTSCVFDTSDLLSPGTLYSVRVHVRTEDEFDRDFDSSWSWWEITAYAQ